MSQPMSSNPLSYESSNPQSTQSIHTPYSARDYVLRGTVVGASLGATGGLAYGAYSRLPMLKAMTSSTLNTAFAAFMYTSLTVALERSLKLDHKSYTNNLASGVITGTSIYGMIVASTGAITSAKDAIKVSMRGSLGGALFGSLAWYVFSKDRSINQSNNQALLDSSAPQSVTQPTESWSPIRQSSEAELTKQASDFENRERRAAQQAEFNLYQQQQSR